MYEKIKVRHIDIREKLIKELIEKKEFYQNLLNLNNDENTHEIINRILSNINTIIQDIKKLNKRDIERIFKNRYSL